jgi:hypothetical protein
VFVAAGGLAVVCALLMRSVPQVPVRAESALPASAG